MQTEETFTYAKGGIVNLSITGGATCDYVRMNHVVDETDLSEQGTEPEDANPATEGQISDELPAQACGTACVKVEGRQSRVSRLSGVVETTCDDEDPEGCEFWEAQCDDVDCIYSSDHCRHQCAMAEVEEEPEVTAPASKRGVRFWGPAPLRYLRLEV